MRLLYFIVCLALSALGSRLSLSQAGTIGSQFRPLTYGTSFKAYYRVQTFAKSIPIYTSDIYENYHNQLRTGLVKQVSSASSGPNSTLQYASKKLLKDQRSGRWLEFSQENLEDDVELFQDDFHLYMNGGSNSYWPHELERDLPRESIWAQPEGGGRFDSDFLTGPFNTNVPGLDLDHFMPDECLEVTHGKLSYIIGVTRLLHLVECRRGEFKLQQPTGAKAELTRGQSRLAYRARSLGVVSTQINTSNSVEKLDVTVTVARASQTDSEPEATLEPGQVPLSVVVSFEPAVSVLVNVYQFESVGSDEHLSESSSGQSVFMMPLAQAHLMPLLESIQPARTGPGRVPESSIASQSFSFEATLTGSHLDLFYRDPIELWVSFDARLSALTTRLSFVDRSASDGLSGWSRSVVSQLHDGLSGVKFHLMDSNYGYVSPRGLSGDLERDEKDDDDDSEGWRSCATDKLATSELALLRNGSDSFLFDLRDAIYMGEALVRGIRCQVYERRLHLIPTMLGLSDQDYATLGVSLAQSEHLYLDLYAYGGPEPEDFDDQANMWALEQRTKFARLDFRFVSQASHAQLRSLTLDLSAFSWAPSTGALGAGEDLPGRLAQECLLAEPGARHLDMELWLGLVHDESTRTPLGLVGVPRPTLALLDELAHDRELLERSVRAMLATSDQLGPFSAIQQVDLESELALTKGQHPHELTSGWTVHELAQLIRVKFSAYELRAHSVEEKFLGHARSLTLSSRINLVNLVAGARSFSYDECKWRAVHTLAGRVSSTDEAEPGTSDAVRLFMYCPERLVCVLGDSSWLPMERGEQLKLENLLEFPYGEPGAQSASRCLVSSVRLRRELPPDSKDRRSLDWWLINFNGGGAAGSRAQRQVRELRLELKVEVSLGGGGGAAGNHRSSAITPSSAVAGSLPVKVNRLRLSERIFATRAASGFARSADAAELSDVSLLIKPLAGLAYLAGSGAGGGSSSVVVVDDDRPQLTVIERRSVAGLAECARLCLHSHECRSFSTCHREPDRQLNGRHRVACVLSRLAWTREADYHKLVRLAGDRRSSSSSSPPKPLTLEVGELIIVSDRRFSGQPLGHPGEPVSVQNQTADTTANHEQANTTLVHFERSPLCSLRARPQLKLFRRLEAHPSSLPAGKFLVFTKSPEQCARMCQERARLVRELEQVRAGGRASGPPAQTGLGSAFRSAACHEFRFSPELAYCQLLPLRNHWALLGLEHLLHPHEEAANATARPEWHGQTEAIRDRPTLSRWLAWFRAPGVPLAEWLARLAHSMREAEHYELDFEQIFLAQRDRRLVLAGGRRATHSGGPKPDKQEGEEGDSDEEFGDGSRLQVRLAHSNLYACARQCMKLRNCRSFDVELTPASGGPAASRRSLESPLGAVERRASTTCLLNTQAAGDLGGDPSAQFELKREGAAAAAAAGSAEWWHYEPTELALFVLTDPGEPAWLGQGEQPLPPVEQ